ncbi:DUF3037 domain-containing protein [Dyadobacter chenhuakuii]|uniref:DUF3037 domain-containing protein n=1 Tax=Dyadobacter chenhuakuii TaxID=2909339 RepID=A0ABY4XPL4_9BACT|nr:DUF3037 domain-containing protein [Dyadobacter chenhuakuii]MCF2494453.1 DUF3037 domain-containing protein [Dyadobacter chenhuakuii]USJ32221.1 DUF3037 domain-containing protein [Dyadobacter chenhuakuii]
MKKYQYQIIRYLHDRVTGEFINVGVIVYAAEDQYLNCKVITKYGRITSFFPGANGKAILKSLRHFEKEIARAKLQFSGLFPTPEDLAEITRAILPNDDSSLTLTEVKKGIDLDFNKSLADLYRLLVTKWQSETDESATSDADVWKKKYKKYFDEYGITAKLTEYEVETKYDSFQFDKAWKNEIWHCYLPVSFDLQNVENIRSKVYKWSGKLAELATAEEKIDVTLLTSIPRKHRELNEFIQDKLSIDSDDIKVKLISERDAENFAKNLVSYMKTSNI